MVENTEGQSLF